MPKAKKILILGADGLLGSELVAVFKKQGSGFFVKECTRKEANIESLHALRVLFAKHRPDAVINSAGLINVDYCENNPQEARRVNAIGAGNVACAMTEAGLKNAILVHISTSDVFGGNKKNFNINEIPRPVNAYGRSKLEGEKLVEDEAKKSGIKFYIIRTSWLYGIKRKTFIDQTSDALRSGREMAAVCDQFNVPTRAKDLAEAIFKLIEKRDRYKSGIYHLANGAARSVSKFNIALEIAKMLNFDRRNVKKVSGKNVFQTKRPRSALLKNSGSPKLPDWKKSLAEYLKLRYD